MARHFLLLLSFLDYVIILISFFRNLTTDGVLGETKTVEVTLALSKYPSNECQGTYTNLWFHEFSILCSLAIYWLSPKWKLLAHLVSLWLVLRAKTQRPHSLYTYICNDNSLLIAVIDLLLYKHQLRCRKKSKWHTFHRDRSPVWADACRLSDISSYPSYPPWGRDSYLVSAAPKAPRRMTTETMHSAQSNITMDDNFKYIAMHLWYLFNIRTSAPTLRYP